MNKAFEDARAYLERAAVIQKDIERNRRRLETLRDIATNTTNKLSDMPRSSSPNLQRMETVICKIADIEREIARDTEALEGARDEITAALCELEDCMEQRVLYDRYVQCMPWREIIAASDYSDRQLYRFHGSGMAHMESILQTKEAV